MTAELWAFRSDLGIRDADLRGMSVEARDGSIGKVEDVVDRVAGGAFLLVDTGPWIFGRTVKLPASVVDAVDHERGVVLVELTKDEIRDAPAYDPAREEAADEAEFSSYYTSRGSRFSRETTATGGTEGLSASAPGPDDQSWAGSAPREWGAGDESAAQFAPDQTGDTLASGAGLMPESERAEETPTISEAPARETSVAEGDESATQFAPDQTGETVGPGAGLMPESEPAEETPTVPDERAMETSVGEGEAESADAGDISLEQEELRPAETTAGQPAETSAAPQRERKSEAGRGRTSRRSADGAPVPRYDSLTAAEVVSRLRNLTQRELAEVERYEKRGESRQTVLQRVDSLREKEPWRGYDDATVDEVRKKLSQSDPDRARAVRDYERRHRDRKGIMEAARRALAG